MRLELSVSERDKRLLKLTGIATILILSVRYLIYPAFEQGQKLEHDIAEISAVYDERHTRTNEPEDLDRSIAELRLLLNEAAKPYYKPLTSWEIDSLITGLAVQHGLSPEYLSLTEAVPGMVEPYILAPEEKTPETFPEDGGVLLAGAHLEASGKTAQWQAFLDDVAQNYPSLRVTRFELPPNGERTGKPELADKIICDLEIYMFESG